MGKLDDLLKNISSDEIKASIDAYIKHLEWKDYIIDKWLDKFQSLPFEQRIELYNKVKAKYDSDEYKDRWYHKGWEPPEYWYFFGLKYARKYGTPFDQDDMFLDECYLIDGYKVSLYVGQGSFVRIEKI